VTLLKAIGRRGFDGLGDLARAGIDFIYPPTCPCCGAGSNPTGGAAKSSLCIACHTELATPVRYPCQRCGAPVGPHIVTTDGCIHCRDERYMFETVYCVGIYHGALRRACLLAKEPGGGPLAAALAGLLLELHRPALEQAQLDLVVPVPHHWTQRWRRPQHAATTLAYTLARSLRTQFDASVLTKIRRTPAQASLPATQRRTNLRGAFQPGKGVDLSGATVLLVDDVLTTGATAQEAAKALLRAHAQRVLVAVAARALGDASIASATSPSGRL
jgi:predicted amidophosphoribosyltransferase